MVTAGLTFAEVRALPEFTLMAKSRLHQLERHVYAQLPRRMRRRRMRSSG
jgi:hypothetical protein